MRSKGRARALTVFLLKQDAPAKLQTTLATVELPVSIGQRQATLFIRPSEEHEPSWLSFLKSAITEAPRMVNSNSAALLLVTVDDREFAITFGYGRSLLVPGCWEEHFGLRVTLNSVDPARIRSIDRMKFDTISQQSQIQASREASIADFGLDVEQDLLRAVTGKPKDEKFGLTLTGKDALHTKVRVTLETLPELLSGYLEAFADTSYREHFPWVDHISAVRDPQRLARLDDVLLDRLRNHQFERIWLAVPDPINWTTVEGFRYRESARATLYDDLHIADFAAAYENPVDLTLSELKHRQVHMVSSETDLVVHRWPVYRCIYAEIEQDGRPYLLNNGNWYSIAADFMESVNNSVAALYDRDKALPSYADESEGAYNERIAAANGGQFALMDRQLIAYPGEAGQIEFCDLYSGDKEIIHVKRYGGSSTLSHLFAQGLTSGTLFCRDSDFRTRVDALLPADFRLGDCAAKPAPDEYTVVFAVVSKSAHDLRLPFFSRVNLRNVARQLQGFGYKVVLAKIPVAVGASAE
jgi:uncharacterized protein (TIGR04141 family)